MEHSINPSENQLEDLKFLDQIDQLIKKIKQKKPDCEAVVLRGDKCVHNHSKKCRVEIKACDKFVTSYHSVCNAILPYIDLAYRDIKLGQTKLEQALLRLTYGELENILEQAQFCARMREFYQNECVVDKCRDYGHDVQIRILEQLVGNIQNKLLEKERANLYELLIRGELTIEEYNEANLQIAQDEIIVPPIKLEKTIVPPVETITPPVKPIVLPPMLKITSAKYWLEQFINRNQPMEMTETYFDNDIIVTIRDYQHDHEYVGLGPIVLASDGSPDPVMAYRSLYRIVVMQHGSDHQKKAFKSYYTDPSRFTIKLLSSESEEPFYRAAYIDLVAYYGFGRTPEEALDRLIANIKLELPL